MGRIDLGGKIPGNLRLLGLHLPAARTVTGALHARTISSEVAANPQAEPNFSTYTRLYSAEGSATQSDAIVT